MSATMNVDHFSQFFNNAPVLYVEGRLHPIALNYTLKEQSDKAKAEAWHATCSSLSLKSNPKSVYSLFRFVAGSSYSSSSFPNFPQLFLSQGVGFGLR